MYARTVNTKERVHSTPYCIHSTWLRRWVWHLTDRQTGRYGSRRLCTWVVWQSAESCRLWHWLMVMHTPHRSGVGA